MTNVDRRDEIEAELEALATREEEIERRLHELVPGRAPSNEPRVIQDYGGAAGKLEHGEWHQLIAEQISLHSRRHTLYSELSSLLTTAEGTRHG